VAIGFPSVRGGIEGFVGIVFWRHWLAKLCGTGCLALWSARSNPPLRRGVRGLSFAPMNFTPAPRATHHSPLVTPAASATRRLLLSQPTTAAKAGVAAAVG